MASTGVKRTIDQYFTPQKKKKLSTQESNVAPSAVQRRSTTDLNQLSSSSKKNDTILETDEECMSNRKITRRSDTSSALEQRQPTKSCPIIQKHHNKSSPQVHKQLQQNISEVQFNANSDEKEHHLHLTYKFLYPPERRDISKRKPDDPDYDENTLYVPESFLNSQTPASRQWWLIKQKNMNAILFFKMGKFYELFNQDAVVGVRDLGINLMKGDETKPAHAGFPEISFEKYSKILIEKGYKVIRIEQTETPAMVEERCQSTGKKGKFDKVVKREICRITTKGTQMLGIYESVFHSSRNQYLLAIYESNQCSLDSSEQKSNVFGFCFIDVTICKLHFGQFNDDHNQSKLNILLAHNSPTEVLHERGNLSNQTLQALSRTGALLTVLKPNKEFWSVQKTLSYLKTHNIFQNESGNFEWPSFLHNLFQEGDSSESLMVLEPKTCFSFAMKSFGALVYYLQSLLIADQVLKCTTFALYESPLEQPNTKNLRQLKSIETSTLPPMIVDHIALRNLEIFLNSSGGTDSTLFASINYCKTHFGQRLLRNWICSPLCDIHQIENRLDAVQSLMSNDNASLMNEVIHVLNQTPDLERLLSKIKSQCFKSEGDTRAIMFDGDQHSKAKIISFLNLLSNFKRLQKFVKSISNLTKNCSSNVLKRLLSLTTDGGLYPEYSEILDHFDNAFDHEEARKIGKIIPAPNTNANYDECKRNIDKIVEHLDDYLEEQKQILKCRQIQFFGSAKNRYQIQVPEAFCKNVPSDYYIETTRKGFKRYYTPTVTKLFQKLTTYEEEMKKTLDCVMSDIFEQFSRKMKLWSAAIECISVLDVLQSIASFVRSLKANNVNVCRPEFHDLTGKPFIKYTDGCHPALVKLDSNYTPNDLELDDRLLLLSGANMGGKSTLMRQTALLVVLAQIGSFVPASSMKLTPVDRIFSRLGASDRLLEGESTFYTELVETSAMLSGASSDSLLLLDELGRGTSTYDGTAIAYSVLKEICNNIKCRCLFSTHYHTLVKDFEHDPRIRLAHMACSVENSDGSVDQFDSDPLKENITFLYKITDGPVGRSYGFNVAKLAGIDTEIIKEAFDKSKELEISLKILEKLQSFCKKNPAPSSRVQLKEKVLNTM